MSVAVISNNYFTFIQPEQKNASTIIDAGSILINSMKSSENYTVSTGNNMEIPILNAITENVFKETDKGENIVHFKNVDSLFDDLNS